MLIHTLSQTYDYRENSLQRYRQSFANISETKRNQRMKRLFKISISTTYPKIIGIEDEVTFLQFDVI